MINYLLKNRILAKAKLLWLNLELFSGIENGQLTLVSLSLFDCRHVKNGFITLFDFKFLFLFSLVLTLEWWEGPTYILNETTKETL